MEFKYQSNILTPFQEEVLTALFRSYNELESFYLTGGTALSGFYLHHRFSEDLDFFTLGEFDSFKLEQMVKDLVSKKNWVLVSSRKSTLFFEVFVQKKGGEPLKIDFVKDIGPHFKDFNLWQDIKIDSWQNIASNKITAIFGRTEVKDFVDFYFLLKEKMPLWDIFKEAQEKDAGLNEFYFAAQLRNINDFNFLPRMLKKISLEELKKDLLKLAEQFVDRARPKE